jgi:hypothetical protein
MAGLKNFSFLLGFFLLSSCGSGQPERSQCQSKDECLNDPKRLCWCSQICKWRKKTASDHPVYIENDPNGKFCYCKKWDYDFYEDNCISGKGIKQPKDAE